MPRSLFFLAGMAAALAYAPGPAHPLGEDDPACVDTVCGMDPYCCDVAWDGYCDWEAETFCELSDDCGPEPTDEVSVAVILYNFNDSAAEPQTASAIRQMIFTGTGTDPQQTSVNAWFDEVTDGETQFVGAGGDPQGDVFGWYTLNRSQILDGRVYACDQNLIPEIEAAAVADGFVRSNYDAVIYMSNVAGCNASHKGNGVIFAAATTPTAWTAYAHELGHHLGLGHGGRLDCTDANGDRVSYGGNCTYQEYGDGYSMMGWDGGFGHFSAGDKLRLGTWELDQDVVEAGTTGTYEIASVTTPACGLPRGLRVATETNPGLKRGGSFSPLWGSAYDDEKWLYVEYRVAEGFNENTQSVAGRYGSVIVHAGVGLQHYQASFLLDMTDGTESFYDPYMTFNKWWHDPSGALSLRVRPGTSGGDTIRVDVILDDGIYFYDDPTPWWLGGW